MSHHFDMSYFKFFATTLSLLFFISSCTDTCEDKNCGDQAYLIGTNQLKVEVFLTSGGSGYNLEGIYQRQ